jgi:Family of unknown function (DUF6232)
MRVLYERGDVIVTDTTFQVGTCTFAIRNLASVEIGTIRPRRSGLGLLTITGIALLILGKYWPEKTPEKAVLPVAGFVSISLALLWFLAGRKKFAVVVTTNAGQQPALVHPNRAYITEVAAAVHAAMTGT